MGPNVDLASLMVRYQGGDSAAATALVNLLSPQLLRFFLMQISSREHADDLLQETWLRVHGVRHTYRAPQPVLPWLYAIARNIRVDHYRKARRTTQREDNIGQHGDFPVPHPQHASRTPDLDALLAALPESQREVVVMLKVSGMTLEEAARATSSSVGSVKQKAHRAYETLRKALAGFRS